MLFRYPGGKKKISKPIVKLLLDRLGNHTQYIEPFFGAGSIGFEFLSNQSTYRHIHNVTINDIDTDIIHIWKSVDKYKFTLLNYIKEYEPTIENFYLYKKLLTSTNELQTKASVIIQYALMKIVIHQTSYSGLGVKSGPIGGKTQKSSGYKVDCRWSPKTLEKNILDCNRILQPYCTKYTSLNAISLLEKTKPSLVYLDPPYYRKGNELYQHGFTQLQHVELAIYLKQSEHDFVLSYDDHEDIRYLYRWAKIEEILVKYTINGIVKTHELLITQ